MFVSQGQQQITLQPGQQVAQTADGQTIVYQPVNADGSILQQGNTFTLIAGIPTVCWWMLSVLAIVPFFWLSADLELNQWLYAKWFTLHTSGSLIYDSWY